MSTTIRFEDENGRVRHQPVDENGHRLWGTLFLQCWSDYRPQGFAARLYRSRSKADRIARRRNRALSRRFSEADE